MSTPGQIFIPGAAQPPPMRAAVPPPVELARPFAPQPAPPAPADVAPRPRQRAPEESTEGLLNSLLTWVVNVGASDLHLASGETPRARLHGMLTPIDGFAPVAAHQLEAVVTAIMNDRQRAVFEKHHDIDLAYALGNTARFRVNVLRQKGKIGAVLRLIPGRVKSAAELGVPEALQRLAQLPRGLVLVTGPTGSGKSTLLASLIDLANTTRSGHIITIEDPVEFRHESKASVMTQREVGEDTDSFATALRASLRQDPDIILLGEMRDLETTQAAIEAAETGHLVFATLHTKSAPEAISRIVNMFPGSMQNQIQATLSNCLEAVITQTLVRTPDGTGRVAAREVMMLNASARNLIRQGKLEQMESVLQTGSEIGSYTLNADLARLVNVREIAYEDALLVASDVGELNLKTSPTLRAPRSHP